MTALLAPDPGAVGIGHIGERREAEVGAGVDLEWPRGAVALPSPRVAACNVGGGACGATERIVVEQRSPRFVSSATRQCQVDGQLGSCSVCAP